MKVKERFFKYTVQNLQKKTQRQKHFVNYDEAKTILLLFESDYIEKNQTIKKIITQMQQDGKNVCAWGFVNKNDISTPIMPLFRVLGKKNIGFLDKPNKEQITDLTNLHYDLLINLATSNNLTIRYLSAFAQASLKIGTQLTCPPIFDFIINIQPANQQTVLRINEDTISIEYLFEQIIFYLKNIQSNE